MMSIKLPPRIEQPRLEGTQSVDERMHVLDVRLFTLLDDVDPSTCEGLLEHAGELQSALELLLLDSEG